MSLRFGLFASGALAALAALAATLVAGDARACGGCFHPENQPETTVVTAHRMALSISPAHTVLWDQIRYAGAPKEFAWVLPVKAGAYVELGADAFFETLDAATSENVSGPQLACTYNGGYDDSAGSSGCGCSGADGASSSMPTSAYDKAGGGSGVTPPVTVVHQGTVGPYETVTLHANVKGALVGWLKNHAFAISSSEQPIVDAYTAEGFDFIALRLQPGASVQQMKPVRVVSPGAEPTLPLRMVGVGTGASVAVTLFVIGEGRWETKNFPNALVDPSSLSWDFAASKSSYAELRGTELSAGDGRTWLTTYAKKGPLLSPVRNPLFATYGGPSSNVQYALSDGSSYQTIADAYVRQGYLEGDNSPNENPVDCQTILHAYAQSPQLVVDVCHAGAGGANAGGAGGAGAGGAGAGGAGACGTAPDGTLDARQLACGKLDDLAVALTGMHPADVWVTRLEAALPHAALKDDLEVTAAKEQTPVENWITAQKATNAPCPLAQPASPGGALPPGRPEGGRRQRDRAMLGVSLAVLAGWLARRGLRRRTIAAT
jgi:hypothetical protein